MRDLARLQASIRTAVISGSVESSLESEIAGGLLSPSQRLQIHQNNYFGTIVDALLGIFPNVSAFVGEVFTRGALKEFIQEQGPVEACLWQYGDKFADFLRAFPHAAEVPYLGDIAALDWSIHALQHQAEPQRQSNVLNPNVRIIESDYPLLQLWMVGTGQLVPEAVHIGQGGQTVAIVLHQGSIQLYTLDGAETEALGMISSQKATVDEALLASLQAKKLIL